MINMAYQLHIGPLHYHQIPEVDRLGKGKKEGTATSTKEITKNLKIHLIHWKGKKQEAEATISMTKKSCRPTAQENQSSERK
eukprot:4679977-Ditylum_brightwellii.AAC.1